MQSAAAYLCFPLFLLAAACGPDLADLVVELPHLPSETDSLVIDTTVDGQRLAPQEVAGALRKFIVRIPFSAASIVAIGVSARDRGLCRLGSATVSTEYRPGEKPVLQISVPTLEPALCPLTVHAPARGRVYSCPEAVTCADGATCTYERPRGEIVQLDTTEIAQWSGGCQGLDTCKLQMDQKQDVTAVTRHCTEATCWRERTSVGEYVSDPYQISFRRVWGKRADDLWVVGDHGRRMHWNGACWMQYSDSQGPPTTTEELMDIWGSSASDIWVVGLKPGRSILHYDGKSWQADAAAADTKDLMGIHGRAADDVWAVGRNGAILHYDGTRWNHLTGVTSKELHAVWAVAADDVWIGGFQTLLHYDGMGFHDVPIRYRALPPPAERQRLQTFWGASKADIWAAGTHNLILHYDGTDWIEDALSQQDDPSQNGYLQLWGAHDRHVWLVGTHCRILNFNGATWKPDAKSQFMFDNCYLVGVFGSGPNDVWAAGGGLNIPGLGQRLDGLLLRYRP